MIGYLEGTVKLQDPGSVTISANGVGYVVHTYQFLELGQNVEMYIHTAVRQDSITLWGFQTSSEVRLFELLLTVSGVGLKTAFGLMSSSTVEELASRIVNGDAKGLSAPGVGTKTASRIVIDLKDKLLQAGLGSSSKEMKDTGKAAIPLPVKTEMTQAMVKLGYNSREIDSAYEAFVADHPEISELTTAELLRHILKYI